MPYEFLDALEAFRDAMRRKMDPLKMDYWALVNHTCEEISEWEANTDGQDEHIDLANMSFLLWWQQEEIGIAGQSCSNSPTNCSELAYGRCNGCRELFCRDCFEDHLHLTCEEVH